MIAFSNVRSRVPRPRFGGVPGVRLGSEWHGRGEVAVVGLHTQMMRVRAGVEPLGRGSGAGETPLAGLPPKPGLRHLVSA
jgi:hypothetical protein